MNDIDVDDVTEDELNLVNDTTPETQNMLDQVADLATRFRKDMSLTDSGLDHLQSLSDAAQDAQVTEHGELGEALDTEIADE